MTASQAAGLVGQSPSNCSWHLRTLAEHGFVREVRGEHGRSRPWQAVSEGLAWGDPDGPDGPAGAEALSDTLLEREMQRFRAARAARGREPQEWRDATGLGPAQLWLTADEAEGISEELRGLLLRHAERVADRTARPAGARLVTMVSWPVPSGPPDADRPA